MRLKQGVRLGDPLSPSLFIIVLELLALSIRNKNQIKGIAVDGSEIYLAIFTDDMTSFVRDTILALPLFKLVETQSIKTCFLWGLDMQMCHSLTHSSVDTPRN